MTTQLEPGSHTRLRALEAQRDEAKEQRDRAEAITLTAQHDLAALLELVDDVIADHRHRCSDPEDCACSIARLIRHVRVGVTT